MLLGLSLLLTSMTAAAPEGGGEGPFTDNDRNAAVVAREIVGGGDYQTALPTAKSVEYSFPLWLSGLGPILTWLAVIAVAAGLLLAIVWLISDYVVPGRRPLGPPATDEEQSESWQKAAGDPGKLASEGRFDEAIHAVLLRAVEALARRTRTHPGRALTSRELVHRFPLEPESRGGLAALVAMVEVSRFGGTSVGNDDYHLSVECFQRCTGEDPAWMR